MSLKLTGLLVVSLASAAEGDTTPTMGTAAGSANPGDIGVIRRGPAAMLLTQGYTSQVDFGFGQGPRLMTSIKDTRTSDLGLGVMVTHHWYSRDPDDNEMPGWTLPGEEITDTSRDGSYRISLGYGFLPQTVMTDLGKSEVRRFAVGASVAYERWTGDLHGLRTGWALDVGVAGRPTRTLALSATARDLLTPWGLRDPSVDLGIWYSPRSYLGLGIDGAYDPNVDELPLVTHGGGEVTVREVMVVRAGYGLEGERQYLAGGIGFKAETTARLDYAIRYDTVGRDVGAIEHSIGLMAAF
ncbi:MAG: hypothetical protein GY913_05015 [Proteobacteria bacterium]|nr:hypothetical protein [Pseudomonadota bacterium]MCP4916261.1 hypothetical protein [Pseudomonadota bacterium]